MQIPLFSHTKEQVADMARILWLPLSATNKSLAVLVKEALSAAAIPAGFLKRASCGGIESSNPHPVSNRPAGAPESVSTPTSEIGYNSTENNLCTTVASMAREVIELLDEGVIFDGSRARTDLSNVTVNKPPAAAVITLACTAAEQMDELES